VIEGSISQRWARALLQLAQEEKNLEGIRTQLNAFAGLLKVEGGKLSEVLESPSFSHKEKVAIVTVLAQSINALPTVKNFLALAMEKDRGLYLNAIIQQFNKLADDLTGIVKAELVVAEALPDGIEERIRVALEKVTKKKIELNVKVDPALMGGAIVRLGSMVVDGSLRAQLEGLTRELAHIE
jgi:F-type H+-transporting ATPase subunit delta